MTDRAATHRADDDARRLRTGLWLGVLGVVVFALTLPVTRLAVGTPQAPELSGAFVATGRAAIAAILSLLLLAFTRAPTPKRADWPALLAVTGGVVFGFPLLTSIAMRHVEAVHASVMIGILPLATALVGALLHRQRPSLGFWLCAVLGSVLVVVFALVKSDGPGLHVQPADGLLLLACGCAAVGYAYGAQLSGRMRAEHVICWALVLGLPISLPAALLSWPAQAGCAERVVGACLHHVVLAVARVFRVVPRAQSGRHGARESGAIAAAVFEHAVRGAAAGRIDRCDRTRVRPGRDRHRVHRPAHAGGAAARTGLPCKRGHAVTPGTIWTQARRAEGMNPSVIREILKITERPGIIGSGRRAALARDLPGASLRSRLRKRVEDRRRGRAAIRGQRGFRPAA